ncbi:MFS transporter [Croceibacterium aestuarii]|uniref:MFS transporter n=1 Tax=Croceibacterium aestuarii TaxID=3064139 RepID=UPI00272E7C36|nr:MFS transporter [Croceibacterium sp. D39]
MTALSDRRAAGVFVLGVIAVTAGVLMHLPMFLVARDMGYRLNGMGMGPEMVWGMVLIVAGVAVAAYGLLPRNVAAQVAASRTIVVSPPEDAPLSAAHWRLMLVLVLALVIDVMKPSSLGFTIPGMIDEYRLGRQVVSLVPLFALLGTATGSVLWGMIADVYGRKASILLSAVVFVGTSICGAMPSLAWNVGMCFLMGLGAGGMLPVTYALLAEMMPSKHRGWSLVLVGGLGSVGGYFAASGLAATLVPAYSWRVLWLVNLPTGLALVALGGLIPESAKFLLARGRNREAQRIMATFGSEARTPGEAVKAQTVRGGSDPLTGFALFAKLFALSMAAACYGLINFGLLLWLPADLLAKGYSIELSSRLLAESALIALPTILFAAWGYSRWSSKRSVLVALAVTIVGLLLVLRLEIAGRGSPVIPVALLIIGTNALIAMLLPYAAESFPFRIRGRATGVVAACSKGGGVLAQVFAVLALVPAMGAVSLALLIPAVTALVLVTLFGREIRGRDLRDLDVDGHTFHAAGI